MGRAKSRTVRADEAVRLYREERLSLSQVEARLRLTLAAVHDRLRRPRIRTHQGELPMFTTRTGAARAFTAVALLLLGGLSLWHTRPARGRAGDTGPPQAAPKDSRARLKALLAERLALARAQAEQIGKAYKAGSVPFARLVEANRAALDAELDQCERDKDRIAVLERAVALLRQYEEQLDRQHKAGGVPATAPQGAKLARLEAEIALERARIKAADPTK